MKKLVEFEHKKSENWSKMLPKWPSGAHLSHLGPSFDVGCISRPLLEAILARFGGLWGTMWDPFGDIFRPLSLFGRSWDLKTVVFWKGRFWHHFLTRFLIKFGSIFGASETFRTLTICVRGCKNHTFGYVGWLIVLDTILGSILAPFWSLKWTSNPIVTHFGDPMWPYRRSFRGYLGVPFFDVFLGCVLNNILSQKAPPKGRSPNL